MGICDKIRGKCQCRENFYGQACEYMTCGGGLGNPCNGHGRCMSMAELALWAEENGDATERVYGSDPNNIDTWDYDRVHGCLCDEGYSGYDCSLIDCPVGDDPGTYEDHVEVQLLQCYGNSGNFTLSFRQKETEILSHNVTADELQAALSALSSIKNVSVYFIKDGLPPNGTLNYVAPVRAKVAGFPPWAFINATGANLIYLPVTPLIRRSNSTFCSTDGTQIAIISFDYTHGDLPAIIPSTRFLEDFINANGEPGTGVINVFQDGASVYSLESIKGTTEVDVCNNRGLCDTSTGLCNCFDDWTSSDGARQGGAGNTRDCGYRNDRLFSYFKSDL